MHGAGGYDDGSPLASALGTRLDAPVDMPQLPEEDMSVEAWSSPIRAALDDVGPDDLVVAHSFGATILMHVLADEPTSARVALLAMPDWSADGWDVAEYVTPSSEVRLSLHHCQDDEVVPFAHLALNAGRLPAASVHEYDSGGHQFDGLTADLAEHLG